MWDHLSTSLANQWLILMRHKPHPKRTSKPLRVRGPTLGKGIQKIIRAKKGEKYYVHIDRELNAMTGKYATPATNELGIQIRTLCPLKDVKSWLDLDETTKAAIIQGVLINASHQKRSKAGKSNRSQLPYNHTNGSRSFLIAMAAMVAKDGELDFPKFYEDSHTSKKTNNWIHPRCRELHVTRDGQCTSGCHRVGNAIDTRGDFKASAWIEEKVLAWIWEWPTTLYHICNTSTR
ncbi:unnamed protein product [Camellia sinensis]